MAAPNGFGSKYDRKIDQNLPNFFFRKKEYKTGLETQFHQNRPHRTDFRLKIARHEKITSSENDTYSNRWGSHQKKISDHPHFLH